jgi:hypothetical protein
VHFRLQILRKLRSEITYGNYIRTYQPFLFCNRILTPNIRSENDRGVGFDLFVWPRLLPGSRLAQGSTEVRTCVLEEVILKVLEKDKSSHALRRGSCIEIPR